MNQIFESFMEARGYYETMLPNLAKAENQDLIDAVVTAQEALDRDESGTEFWQELRDKAVQILKDRDASYANLPKPPISLMVLLAAAFLLADDGACELDKLSTEALEKLLAESIEDGNQTCAECLKKELQKRK